MTIDEVTQIVDSIRDAYVNPSDQRSREIKLHRDVLTFIAEDMNDIPVKDRLCHYVELARAALTTKEIVFTRFD